MLQHGFVLGHRIEGALRSQIYLSDREHRRRASVAVGAFFNERQKIPFRFLVFFLVFLSPALAFAQDSLTYELTAKSRPPVVIQQSAVVKLAPLSLIDLDPTVQVAIEIPLRPQLSIQQEVGYGWPKLGLFSYQTLADRAKTTFRVRTHLETH